MSYEIRAPGVPTPNAASAGAGTRRLENAAGPGFKLSLPGPRALAPRELPSPGIVGHVDESTEHALPAIVTDESIVDVALYYILSSPWTSFFPDVDPIIRTMSIAYSAPAVCNALIPRLLRARVEAEPADLDISVMVVHGIPSHTEPLPGKAIGGASLPHHHHHQQSQHSSQPLSAASTPGYSTTPSYGRPWPGLHPHNHHQLQRGPASSSMVDLPLAAQELVRNSPPQSPLHQAWTAVDLDEDVGQNDNIFHSFSSLPARPDKVVVPPRSVHVSLAIYALPTHNLPPFESVYARYKELAPGGVMVLCYPTSLSMYRQHVLPCLDSTLMHLLALNMVSSQTCEALTMPPWPRSLPTFAEQRNTLAGLPGAEILFAQHVERYEVADWGQRWLLEEVQWLRGALEATEVSTSQILIKIIQGMKASPEWRKTAVSELGFFVLRKSHVGTPGW